MFDVSKHNNEDNCWVTLEDSVYDITKFIPYHPDEAIIGQCGKDANQMFKIVGHGDRHMEHIKNFKIG